jgi:4-amino-4-deoxy-L-arabinose transferase-like glycosyltransferase
LINILWLLFGVSAQAAMAAPFVAAFSVLVLTARLASRIYPQSPEAPFISVAILGGCLPFVIYSNLIMFDVLLTVSVLLAVTALWDYIKTRKNIHIGLFALAIGLGLLSKGPAVLLHIAPALLLVKIWAGSDRPPVKIMVAENNRWDGLSVLHWPYAGRYPPQSKGGENSPRKYSMAKRLVAWSMPSTINAPIFWYLTFVPLFVMPWIFSPALWSGLKSMWQNTPSIAKFLGLWIALIFAAFSFISGKQVHYLLPLLPPMALLFCGAFLERTTPLRRRDVWPIIGGAAFLALIPALVHFFCNGYCYLATQFHAYFRRIRAYESATICLCRYHDSMRRIDHMPDPT